MTTDEQVRAIISRAEDDLSHELGKKVYLFFKFIDNKISVGQIINTVERVTKIDISKISDRGKTFNVAMARHLLCYFLRAYTSMSFIQIGRLLNRDHTSIMNSFKVVKAMIETENPDYMILFREIKAILNNDTETNLSTVYRPVPDIQSVAK